MKISKQYAVCMVNADFSGLLLEDVTALNDFMNEHGDFTVTDWSEDSNGINGKCFISGLYDCCVEIELNNKH